MHPARLVPAFALAGALAIALAACSAGAAPGWTFAPTPTPTLAPSVGPSGAASAAPSSASPASAAPSTAASAAPSSVASAAPSSVASAAPSGATGGTVLNEVASGVTFQTASFQAPANQPFQIAFDNQDAAIQHNIQIADGSGAFVFEGDAVTGIAQTIYSVPALAAGTYKFSCKFHPAMIGDLMVQ